MAYTRRSLLVFSYFSSPLPHRLFRSMFLLNSQNTSKGSFSFELIFHSKLHAAFQYYLPEEVYADFMSQRTLVDRNAVLNRYVTQNGIDVLNVSNTKGAFLYKMLINKHRLL